MKTFKHPVLYWALLLIALGVVLVIAFVATRMPSTNVVTTVDDLWPTGYHTAVIKALSETKTALAKPATRATDAAATQSSTVIP